MATKSSSRKTSSAGKKSSSGSRSHSSTKSTSGRKSTSTRKSPSAKKRASSKKKSSRKYSPSSHKNVEREMREFKRGKLKSGSGRKVKSRKQAIAMGLSEARRAGKEVPKKKN